MANPSVTVITVTFNSHDMVGHAFDALREAHNAGLVDAVVVDNASRDGTADYVAKHHSWVTLVRSGENLGFGRGCNLGFARVTTPYVLFLNPDAVLDCDALRTLITFMDRRPAAGIATPAAVHRDGKLQDAGRMTTPQTLLLAAIGSRRPYPQQRPVVPAEKPFRTNWVCGAVMLIRSDLFRTLGGFDPRFFLYFEETDLCRRAARLGAEIWAVGESVARHAGGASARATGRPMRSACLDDHYRRSQHLYLVKHFGRARTFVTRATVVALDGARRLRARLAGRVDRGVPTPAHPKLSVPQPRDVI